MAKKEKVQLTPEELSAKKLKKKKSWARVGAVVVALAITVGVYAIGAKGGHKEVVKEAPTVTVIQKVTQATTKAPETTTAPSTTKAPETTKAAETTTKPATTAASSSGGISDILGTITDGLGSLIGGLGSGSSSLPSIDGNSAADTVEQIGSAGQDFFYGIADKIEQGTGSIGQ